jgi:hypothetical protein
LSYDERSGVLADLAVLIECKRSAHPFVFFKNVSERPVPGFPKVAGLKRGIVEIHESSSGRYSEMRGAEVLGLTDVDYVIQGPARCSAFSRATLSGKKVELSGAELFNGLILPLVKAFDHATATFAPSGGGGQLAVRLILAIGVLDAPMILVESPHRASAPVLTPWVRVLRQESIEDPKSLSRFRYYAIDLVHIEYFDTFLREKLLPLAKVFGSRVAKMGEILQHGGIVDSLDGRRWDSVRPRPR